MLGLYQERRILTGKGRRTAGHRQARVRQTACAQKGIAYFDYSQEELADEFQMLGMVCSHGEDL